MRLKEEAAQGLAWALCMKSSYLKMFWLLFFSDAVKWEFSI